MEETGWGTAEQGLITHRYDMVCADVCLDAQRTKASWYATPLVHTPNYLFVRAGDNRFDNDIEKLNDPAVKIAVFPNTILDYAVRERFPKAGRLEANDFNGDSDLMMMVISKKADASVNMKVTLDNFNTHNPDNRVKVVGAAVKNCHGGFMLPRGDAEFQQMINAAITELNMSNKVREIMKKYEPDDRSYWRPAALPYREE